MGETEILESLSITKLHPLFAAEVAGVDLAAPGAAALREIGEAIARYGVLVFRGQALTDEQQIALARHFGPVELSTAIHRKDNKLRLGRPEMADVSNLDENHRPRAIDDRQRMFSLGNMLWHTDSSFRQVRGALSFLYARDVPAKGGETEFTDMRAAYDALPETMKARLDGLVAEHSLMHSRATLGFTDFAPEEYAALPPSRHPVVQVHAGSGRRTLYVASHASHIVGWPVPEGRMLLRDLIEFATQREFVHVHRWCPGDLVLWDNRCTMHRGRPYDPAERRDLRRVTTSDTGATNGATIGAAAGTA